MKTHGTENTERQREKHGKRNVSRLDLNESIDRGAKSQGSGHKRQGFEEKPGTR